MNWVKKKPTTPGEYMTRIERGGEQTRVVVRKRGRGLECCPEGYTSVPMREIGDDELWWREVTGKKRGK